MITAETLLAAPPVARLVEVVVPPSAESRVERVVLVEDARALRDAPARATVVLGRGASAEATKYRLDIALRVAASRGVSVVVFTGTPVDVSPTALRIAERGSVALVRGLPDVDLAELVTTLQREIEGDASAVLGRLRGAISALIEAEVAGAEPDRLAASVGGALGTRLEHRVRADGLPHAAVTVEGRSEGVVCALDADAGQDAGVEIALHVAAAAIGRTISTRRAVAEISAQSRAELLSALLASDSSASAPIELRARNAGVPLDSWHAAVLLEVENLSILADDEIAAFELAQTVTRTALESARASGGTWNHTRIGSTLLLVRTTESDTGTQGAAEAAKAAGRAISRLGGRVPGIVIRCGVGSVRPGAMGLRVSVSEARAAIAAARLTERANIPVRFDEAGLRRTLIEWYASESARDAVQSVLAPLERLGATKGRTAIRTLEAFLDNQSSLARTAAVLHLHRNAVAYRIKRIFSLLEVDPDDPDQRLLLHLACRARALS